MIGRHQNADQRLDDELALRLLSTSYAAAVDLRDGDRFASLFVEHGELVVPNYPEDFRPSITRAGHDELRRIPEALRHYRRTFHQMSNHEFVIEADTASGSVRCPSRDGGRDRFAGYRHRHVGGYRGGLVHPLRRWLPTDRG